MTAQANIEELLANVYELMGITFYGETFDSEESATTRLSPEVVARYSKQYNSSFPDQPYDYGLIRDAVRKSFFAELDTKVSPTAGNLRLLFGQTGDTYDTVLYTDGARNGILASMVREGYDSGYIHEVDAILEKGTRIFRAGFKEIIVLRDGSVSVPDPGGLAFEYNDDGSADVPTDIRLNSNVTRLLF